MYSNQEVKVNLYWGAYYFTKVSLNQGADYFIKDSLNQEVKDYSSQAAIMSIIKGSLNQEVDSYYFKPSQEINSFDLADY